MPDLQKGRIMHNLCMFSNHKLPTEAQICLQNADVFSMTHYHQFLVVTHRCSASYVSYR